jgi:hypothetical protein
MPLDDFSFPQAVHHRYSLSYPKIMAAPITYPNSSFYNERGNQFIDTTITADSVVLGGEFSPMQADERLKLFPSTFYSEQK